MRQRIILPLLAAMAAALWLCHGAAPIALAQEAAGSAFPAIVVEENVEVRAGPGLTYYVMGQLPRGTNVNVETVTEGWYQITPPTGVYSYVSKMDVDAKGDGKTGLVNAAKADVKAASLKGPGDSYRPQGKLSKDQVVTIVAEEGSYYKIQPPKGVYVFLPPNAIRRAPAPGSPAPAPAVMGVPSPGTAVTPAPATAVPRAGVSVPAVAATRPAGQMTFSPVPATKPEAAAAAMVRPVAATRPAPPRPIRSDSSSERAISSPRAVEPKPAPGELVQPQPVSQAMKALEARLAQADRLPLEDQPLDEMIEAYQAAAGDQSLPVMDLQIAAVRVAQLKRNADLAATLRSLRKVRDQAGGPMTMPAPRAATTNRYNPANYEAVGQLLASSVYDGQSGPRLYRLVDPSSMRTVIYVLPGGKLNPLATLGRIVGINGPTRYDPTLKLRVIEVEAAEVLEPAAAP